MKMEKVRELLIAKKFIKYSNKYNSENSYYLNIMTNRMILTGAYTDLENIVEETTNFLPSFCDFSERCRYIMNLISKKLTCENCGAYLELGSRYLRMKKTTNIGRTCSLHCDNKLRQKENRLPAIGPHVFKKGSLEKILEGMKKYREKHSQKGVSYEKRYGEKRALEIKEKIYKNANRNNNGFYSGNREEIKNPFNGRKILLLSSMEKEFVNFAFNNNLYFNKTILKIRYFNRIKNSYRHYNPDFIFKRNEKIYLVEIKPLGALKDTQHKLNIVNRDKLRALRSFCKKHNIIALTFNKRDLKNSETLLEEIDNCSSDNFEKYRL